MPPLRGSVDFGMGSQCLPPQHAQRRCMLGTPGSALGYVVSSLAGLGEDAPGPAARGECQAAAWKAALQNVAAKAATDKAGAKMPPRSLAPFARDKRVALQKRRGNDGQAQGRWKRDLGKIPQGPQRVENARLPPGRRRYKMSRLKPRPMPMPTGRRQSKIPMGLIETLRFALRDTAAILPPLAAATLRAAGNPRRERQF